MLGIRTRPTGLLATLVLIACLVLPAQAAGNGDAAGAIRDVVMTSLMSWETLEEAEFAGTAHPDLVYAPISRGR